MINTNFFKVRGVRIFLVGFVLVLAGTILLVLEIEFPYTGRLWWAGFAISLIGMILAIIQVTSRKPPPE
jgi:membrane-bound ClpP family serine protease